MKLEWNRKSTTIAVYAFLVLAAAILFWVFLANFGGLMAFISNVFSYLGPFAYGFALAYLMSPLLRFVERCLPTRKRLKPKTRRNLAMLLTYVMVFSVVILFFVMATPPIADSIKSIVQNMSYYTESARNITDAIQEFIHLDAIPAEITDAVNGFFSYLYGLLRNVLLYVLGLTTKLTSVIINSFIGIIISIYMLGTKERLFAQCKKILHVFLPKKLVQDIINLTHDSNTKFGGFLSGKVIDSLIIGVICLLGMYAFKMPFPEFISLIVGLFNIIPFFGPIVGAIPGFLLVLVSGSVGQAFGFLLFILVLQQFDGNILGPAILGQSTGLSAMWVMFAILLFGGLYGFVGMIIGVPLLSVIFGVLRAFANRRLIKRGLPTELEEYASERHQLID